MSVVVTPEITPTFTQIGPLCQNSTAPILPTSSTNLPAITGTWNAVLSTASAGTIIYTFTPNGGQCAIPTTMSVIVTPEITPTFTQLGPLCQNSVAPVLILKDPIVRSQKPDGFNFCALIDGSEKSMKGLDLLCRMRQA